MKHPFALALLLICFINLNAQDEKQPDTKPTLGDIGLRYALNFNGGIQQQIALSGFITKRLELGGTVAFTYKRTNTTYSGTAIVRGTTFDSIPTATNSSAKNTTYSLTFTPFLAYHVPMRGKVDLYGGGFVIFGMANNNTRNVTTFDGLDYHQTNNTITTSPVTYTVGGGVFAGCQYFFYRRLALGVQAGLTASGVIKNGNTATVNTEINSGSQNPYYNSNNQSNYAHTNSKQLNLTTGANAGVTLTFYFARKAKTVVAAPAM